MEWVLGLLVSIPPWQSWSHLLQLLMALGSRAGLASKFPWNARMRASLRNNYPGDCQHHLLLVQSCSHSWSVFLLQEVPGAGPCRQRAAPFSRLACHTLQPPWQLINASAVEWQFCFTPSSIIPAPFPGGLRTLTNCRITYRGLAVPPIVCLNKCPAFFHKLQEGERGRAEK